MSRSPLADASPLCFIWRVGVLGSGLVQQLRPPHAIHPISVAVLREPTLLVTLRSAVASGRHSSKKKLSSLIPYRDARTLVKNTLPAVSIRAMTRVSVAIFGKSAD